MNAAIRDRIALLESTRRAARRLLLPPICIGLAALCWQDVAATEIEQAYTEDLGDGGSAGGGDDVRAELDREHALFREQYSNGDYAAALEAAKRVISLSIEAYGPEDVNVARALNNLAVTQAAAGDLVAARENFDAAIALREKITGSVIDPGLVNPLRGLAGVYMASRDAELAIPTYERAIHITHVNEGPQNMDQVPLMEGLTRAYLELGDINDAKKLQDKIYDLHRRRYSVKDDRFLDAVVRRGGWYHRLGFFDEEVMLYRRLIRSIELNFGSDSPRLIQPLIRLAFAAALQQGVDTKYEEGRRAASRAVRIARDNPEIGKERLARTLLHQGDFAVMVGQPRKSRAAYEEAWELLSSSEELLPIREAELEQPVIVQRQYPESVYKRDPSEGEAFARMSRDRGYVEVEYIVGTYGRPLQVEVVDSEPPGLLDVHVARRVKEFRYRPKMQDGQPVESDVLKFRHEFRYRQDRLSTQDRRRIENLRERRRARAEDEAEEAAEAVADDNADGTP